MSALILKAANQFSVVFLGTARSDDSTGDRVNYRYTCAILVAFILIVSNREFTNKRIQCWVPAFFTGNYEQYANEVCWVRNTYYVADESQIPDNEDIRRQSSIRYYQWIPFILFFEAFCFLLPYIFWRSLCQASGIDVRDIVEAATIYKSSTSEEKREELMKFIVAVIDQYVDDPRRQSDNRVTAWWKKCFLMFFPTSGRYMGDYLRNLFLFTKLLYVANVFCQVFILSFLLDQPFWSLGFTIFKHLYDGKGWNFHSRYFPKVTLWFERNSRSKQQRRCDHHSHLSFSDFQIREPNALPTTHTYTVMCVLPINLFNQQIFTLIWFWYLVVIVCTVYDLFIWLYRLFVRRPMYLRERLKVLPIESRKKWPFDDICKNHMSPSDKEHKKKVENREESATTGDEIYLPADGSEEIHHQSRMFIVPQMYYDKSRTIFHFFDLEYLEADGHFIMRIISSNASDFVSTKILHELYKLCCEKRFRPYKFELAEPTTSQVLYKYIIMPKNLSKPPTNPTKNDEPTDSSNSIQRLTTALYPDDQPPVAVRQRTINPSSNV